MSSDEIGMMKDSLRALRDLTDEIRQSNEGFRLVLFGDSQKGIVGIVAEAAEIRATVRRMETRLVFYAGAISVVTIIAPILIVFFLNK